MPRPKITPAQRASKTAADLDLVANAVAQARKALAAGDRDSLAEAAKFIEAVGCYARRTAESLPEAQAAPAKRAIRIVGPNLSNQSHGQFIAVEVGTREDAMVKRAEPREWAQGWVVQAATITEVGDNIYEDHIAEGSMEPGEGASDVWNIAKLPVA